MKTRFVLMLLIGVAGIGLSSTSDAQSTPTVTFSHGFETGNEIWTLVGHAGFDIAQSFARTGQNNGWIRNYEGWNAIESTDPVLNLASGWSWWCTASAYLRSSGNVSNLYLSVLNEYGSVVREIGPKGGSEIGVWPNYQYLAFSFRVDNRPRFYAKSTMVRPSKPLAFRVGFWGNGADAWVQVDDVKLTCTGETYLQ